MGIYDQYYYTPNKTGKIYLITNLKNGKKYVGYTSKSICRRWKEHQWCAATNQRNYYLYNAIKKYGIDNFKIQFLTESVDLKYAKDVLEPYYISIHKSNCRDFGYNMTSGGDGWNGMKHSDESKEKMRLSQLGKRHTAQSKEKLRKANLGKVMSEESRQKMSVWQKGKTYDELYGYEKSQRMKKNQSISRMGKTQSEETIEKKVDSVSRKWKIITPDNKIVIVKNLSQFCRDHNLDSGHMNRVSKGIRNHHKKYKCFKLN